MNITSQLSMLLFSAALLSASSLAQDTGMLSGRVLGGDTKTGLPGANVYIPAMGKGAVTDTDGRYMIKGLPDGPVSVEFSFIGYRKLIRKVTISGATHFDIFLTAMVFEMETVIREVNRASIRRTPIAFTDISREDMNERYTTQDIPGLLAMVPGVFTTSRGIGEAGVFIRGFDAERTQVMINGVPVNDPESQVVYWSNWSGLAGNTNSIQVQRGVGSSLYGSGAFGGSINLLTETTDPHERFVLRLTGGGYENESDRTAGNYIGALSYNSGLLADGTLGFNFRYERKYGDSYIRNTKYDGHSFYFAFQSLIGDHKLTFNVIGAPQKHNQALAAQDLQLLGGLGREYSRNDHPYQENYYFKPQFELHDEWTIADDKFLATNAFLTFGEGGGRYLRNDVFNVATGDIRFKSVSQSTDDKYFGRNARWIYENTGVALTGYAPADTTYNGQPVSKSENLLSETYSHSWRNDSQNNHMQFGLNTAFQHEINDQWTYTLGGEFRSWNADHFAQSKDFRMFDGSGGAVTLGEVQRRYDYTGNVLNLSGFVRVLFSPVKPLTLMADAMYASYTFSVDENAIEIYDFGASRFAGESYYATKNLRDDAGNLKYTENDYSRIYRFFAPKFGVNYNFTNEINALVNYSIAYKEPRVTDWYSRSEGPRLVGDGRDAAQELKPERLDNLEFGAAYRTPALRIEANYYYMNFIDKIESVTLQSGESETINAGKALHQGLELAVNGRMRHLLYGLSVTLASNKWEEMSVKEIFGAPAEDVVGKVVPFSPETMVTAEIGWDFTPVKLKFVIGGRYFDDYYGSYTNTYFTSYDDAGNGTGLAEARLPVHFDLYARIVYDLYFSSSRLRFILSGSNLTNNDNFTEADWAQDFGRNDNLNGEYYMYVAQAPLRNVFLTFQLEF